MKYINEDELDIYSNQISICFHIFLLYESILNFNKSPLNREKILFQRYCVTYVTPNRFFTRSGKELKCLGPVWQIEFLKLEVLMNGMSKFRLKEFLVVYITF